MITESEMDGSEVVQHYRDGQRVFRAIDVATGFEAFRGLDLRGIDLSHCIVVGDFRGADLREARFVDANIKTCDFRDADLRNADFSGAALCSAGFTDARMDNAIFTDAYYHNHKLKAGEQPDW